MRVWEYYYEEIENIKRITINDKADYQEVSYKNRLITQPLCWGSPAGSNVGTDDGVVGGSGIFSGKSSDEKLRMCGYTGDWSPQNALARGLITDVSIPCPPGTIKFNKYAANDLVAILNEIKSQLPWFTLRISSAFRSSLSAGGKSRC